jgi:hypothetical protein
MCMKNCALFHSDRFVFVCVSACVYGLCAYGVCVCVCFEVGHVSGLCTDLFGGRCSKE